MAYFGLINFSSIGGSFGNQSSAGIYSAISNYKQARAIKTAVNTLHSSKLSAKNSKEQAAVDARLKKISDSIKGQSSGASSSGFTTASGESTVTALAKEAGEKMYQEATGTGKKIDTTV